MMMLNGKASLSPAEMPAVVTVPWLLWPFVSSFKLQLLESCEFLHFILRTKPHQNTLTSLATVDIKSRHDIEQTKPISFLLFSERRSPWFVGLCFHSQQPFFVWVLSAGDHRSAYQFPRFPQLSLHGESHGQDFLSGSWLQSVKCAQTSKRKLKGCVWETLLNEPKPLCCQLLKASWSPVA